MTKKIFLLVWSLCWLGQISEAKMCWEECSAGSGVVERADILGCRRRSTYQVSQDFRCQGRLGPPCTVFRGDTVRLDVDWVNPGILDMTQSTHWVSWVELPWVGMETEACPYLDTGAGCGNNTVDISVTSSPHTSHSYLQTRTSNFNFPIYIEKLYPAG